MKYLIFLLVSNYAFASFFPEDLRILEKNKIENIPASFEQIVSSFKLIYEPEVISQGGNLIVVFDRDNDRVNATASRDGDDWIITFMGGLLRHRNFNNDIFTAILCHEMGHHLGGAPFKFPGEGKRGWISVEGQSDYYATNICLKKLYEHLNHEQYLKKNPPQKLIKKACLNHDDRNLCLRLGVVAEKTGKFIDKLSRGRRGRRGPIPRISNPDRSVVRATTIQHPNKQCRLDTYFQGALCKRYFFAKDPNCVQGEVGARPLCWFFPKRK